MSGTAGLARCSVDVRTRNKGVGAMVDPGDFWVQDWMAALDEHGERAAADAERLGLRPLTIRIDDQAWTLRLTEGRIEAVAGQSAALLVELDRAAFSDLVHERKTALGLAIGGRVAGDDVSNQTFCAWDPVLRSVFDGRGVYQPGDMTLRALDGTDLDLDQQFRLGERPRQAAHFLSEAGFLVLKDVFTEDEMVPPTPTSGVAVAAARSRRR